MRLVTVTHLRRRLERSLMTEPRGFWLRNAFFEACSDLLPQGRVVVRTNPFAAAIWQAAADARIRMLLFPVSDGTDLVLEASVGRIPALFHFKAKRFKMRMVALSAQIRRRVESEPSKSTETPLNVPNSSASEPWFIGNLNESSSITSRPSAAWHSERR